MLYQSFTYVVFQQHNLTIKLSETVLLTIISYIIAFIDKLKLGWTAAKCLKVLTKLLWMQ